MKYFSQPIFKFLSDHVFSEISGDFPESEHQGIEQFSALVSDQARFARSFGSCPGSCQEATFSGLAFDF